MTGKSDRIDRREFVEWLGIGGALALAGCTSNGGGDGETTTTEDGDTDTNGETTATSGSASMHLKFGTGTATESLNFMIGTQGIDWIVSNWAYSNLTRYNSNLEVKPDLAEDWEGNSDASEWTFMLRDGATFQHNGNEVVAEDVKATLDKMYAEESSSPGKGSLGPIESVEVVDEKTVQINTETPYSALPKAMAKQWGRIAPKDVVENQFDSMSEEEFGSGPFTLESADFGNELVYTAYDDYYMEDEEGNQLPHLDTITLTVIKESSTRVNSLTNGDTHVINEIPSAQWERLKNAGNVTTYRAEGGWHVPITMRLDTEPFDDVRVRQAFKYAIDRNAMIASAANGLGVTGRDARVSPANEYHADLPDKYGDGANPEKAKELLAEAGYEDGLELDFPLITSEGDPLMIPTSTLAQQHHKAAGIDYEIKQVTWETFVSDYFLDHPFSQLSYATRLIDDGLLFINSHKDGAWSDETKFYLDDKYPEFEEALETARSTTSDEEKREMYRKCQEIQRDRDGYIVPFWSDTLGATSSNLEGYEQDPIQTHYWLEDVSIQQ